MCIYACVLFTSNATLLYFNNTTFHCSSTTLGLCSEESSCLGAYLRCLVTCIFFQLLFFQRGDGNLSQLISSKRLRHTISVINLFMIQ